MPFGWRAGVAALLAALLVAGFFVSDWLVVAVVLTVLVLAVAYAARALAQGQSEWFGREQAHRDARERHRRRSGS